MASLLVDHGLVTVICADGSAATNAKVRIVHLPDQENTFPDRNGFVGRADNRWFIREARHLAQSFIFWPDRQKRWARSAVLHIDKVLRNDVRNIVITSGPRFSVHTEMARLLRKEARNVFWVMDLRDPWTNDPAPGMRRRTPSFLTRIEAKMEAACHRQANLVTTVSDVMTKMMKRDFSSPAVTIYNGYPEVSQSSRSTHDAQHTGPLRIRYLGSIIHGLRSPGLIFEAADRMALQAESLQFHFWCNDPDLIRKEARAHSVEHLVFCHPPVSLEDSKRIQAQPGANLVLNNIGMAANHIVTGKVFEAIAANRPTIAITGPNSELRSILEKCNCNGLVWDSSTATAALERFLGGDLRDLSDPSGQFCRRSAVEKLIREIDCKTRNIDDRTKDPALS